MLIYFTTILVATVFHELMHHLTKATYAFRITPAGMNGYNADFGDPGDELEILLLGGIVTVVWEKDGLGDMGKIQKLVVVYYRHQWVLREHCCNKICLFC